MAKQNFAKLKEVFIDGQPALVAESSRIIDLVDPEVQSVQAFNPRTAKGEVIHRDQFNRTVPEGFTTHLTAIEKGAGRAGGSWLGRTAFPA